MPRKLVLGGVLLLAGGLLAWFFSRSVRHQPAGVVPAGPADAQVPMPEAEGGDASSASVEEAGEDGTVLVDAEARSVVPQNPERVWSAAVLVESGALAAGAEVSWTPIEGFLLHGEYAWSEIDVAWLASASRSALVDAQGRFGFAGAPPMGPQSGAVVWISRVGQESLFEVNPPGLLGLAGRQYVLRDAEPIRVIVRDAAGNPVEGAALEHHGVSLEGISPHEVGRHVPLLYLRTATTDARGAAEFAAFPGTSAVRARAGGRLTRPKLVAPAQRRVELELHDTFVVEGTLRLPVIDSAAGAPPRIAFSVLHGNVWKELGSLVVGSSAWGPLDLPFVSGDAYRARVHGPALVPSEVLFPRPTPGERVRLDLAAETGVAQWFRVMDEAEQPLPEAEVEVTWLANGQVQGQKGHARPDGYVLVTGIQPGPSGGRVSCVGYATQVLESVVLPPPEPNTSPVYLARAGRLRGRVTLSGEPVPDFEVTTWPMDEHLRRSSRAFLDAENGEFVLEDVPLGPLGIVAASPGSPGCSEVRVEVTEEGADVHLELDLPIEGKGRVVDGATGEPLATALIRPQVMGGARPVSPWGMPVPVQPDGAFEMRAFRAGQSTVFVDAPGYGTRQATAVADGGLVDFGVIELLGLVDLEVVLVGAEEPSGFSLTARGPAELTFPAFERIEDGKLRGRLEGISPGRYVFYLTHADSSVDAMEALVDRSRPVLQLHVGGGGALEVRAPTSLQDAELTLLLEYSWAGDPAAQRAITLGSLRSWTFSGLPEGPVSIRLTAGRQTLAFAEAVIRPGETVLVELTPGESALDLHLTDREGEPVVGGRVTLRGLDGVAARIFSDVTDAAGTIRFTSLPAGAFSLTIVHAHAGLLTDAELALAEGEQRELKVELDASAALNLRLVDGETPLPGASLRVLDRQGNPILGPFGADADGRVFLSALSPATYSVDVQGAGLWPFRAPLTAAAGSPLQSVQVYRTGALTLRIQNPLETPVSGAHVELDFEPTGESAADWVLAGRSTADYPLVSDTHGEVSLQEIPRGPYVWRIGELSGRLDVQPATETTYTVVLIPE